MHSIKVINACKIMRQVFQDDLKLAKTLKWIENEELFRLLLVFKNRQHLSKSCMHMKLWDKVFKMTSSWAKTLKWVKHGQMNYFDGLLFGSY